LKIYTGFGDAGKTRLYSGQIVDKDNLRVETYGILDELNSAIGILKTYIENNLLLKDLQTIQNDIFKISSELATPADVPIKSFIPAVNEEKIKDIENKIDKLDSQLDPLKNFILPGGSRGAAFCHLARTICRRAERTLISLNKTESIDSHIIVFINRLSDYLFVLARFINKEQNITDIIWNKD
jgi:cob(I)alamin adenosyltransferase